MSGEAIRWLAAALRKHCLDEPSEIAYLELSVQHPHLAMYFLRQSSADLTAWFR